MWHIKIEGIKHGFYTTSLQNLISFYIYLIRITWFSDFLMVFPLKKKKKKGLIMMSHIFKVKGIWHMNGIKLIQITWLLHVNWFLQNLSINLQFAPNNSSIVQNSKTIANKEEKNPRLEVSKSLDVPNNDQKLVETWNANMIKVF